jgi:hypothetical protein
MLESEWNSSAVNYAMNAQLLIKMQYAHLVKGPCEQRTNPQSIDTIASILMSLMLRRFSCFPETHVKT